MGVRNQIPEGTGFGTMRLEKLGKMGRGRWFEMLEWENWGLGLLGWEMGIVETRRLRFPGWVYNTMRKVTMWLNDVGVRWWNCISQKGFRGVSEAFLKTLVKPLIRRLGSLF